MAGILIGCDPANDGHVDNGNEMPDYSEPGMYTPGTLESEMVGSTGETISLQVWYPSNDDPGEGVRYDALWDGDATEGLVPDCSQRRPVLVFSHGWGGIRWQSAFLTEHLASHGYVVIAPDHTHNTFLDDDSAYFDDVVVRRPIDVSDSFDWLLTQSADVNGPMSNCVDVNGGYAVSGHSFGGYTSFAVAGAGVHDPFSDAVLDLSDARVGSTRSRTLGRRQCTHHRDHGDCLDSRHDPVGHLGRKHHLGTGHLAVRWPNDRAPLPRRIPQCGSLQLCARGLSDICRRRWMRQRLHRRRNVYTTGSHSGSGIPGVHARRRRRTPPTPRREPMELIWQ